MCSMQRQSIILLWSIVRSQQRRFRIINVKMCLKIVKCLWILYVIVVSLFVQPVHNACLLHTLL